MKGGHNKKPLALHAREGTGRPSRQNGNQPRPRPTAPTCPGWLAPEAKAEWKRFDTRLEWYTVTGKRDKTATLSVHPVLRAEFAPWRRKGFIFPGRFGGGVNPATVGTWTAEVAEAAGIGRVRTHQLRHTSLTTALDNTENLRSVMAFARHTRPDVTAGYTRTTKEQLQAVSAALDFG